MINFKSFTDSHNINSEGEFSFELLDKFKVIKNIEIFYPKTINDFENFIIDKEIIAINDIGRSFSGLKMLKMHFLLAKYRIKQVQIDQMGFYNEGHVLRRSFWMNLKYKLKRNYSHKLVVLLSNFGLIPKIQIKFTSSSKIIEIINNNFIKKILYKLKLFYARELMLVNSRSFDIFKNNKIEISEEKIVLLDLFFYHPEYMAVQGKPDKKKIEKHYYHLNKLINNLYAMYKKKIVICIHPKDNLEHKKKYFPNLDIVQYKNRESIYKAFLVLFFDTSAIVDAILLKKKILLLISNFAPKNVSKIGLDMIRRSGILKVNIEDELNADKNKFLSKLDSTKENYSNYIKSYIAPDGENLGYEKIIKTLKERFF